MPPSSSSRLSDTPAAASRPAIYELSSSPISKQITLPVTQPTRAKKAKMEPKAEQDLAPIFKSDLTNLRSLVTCSICDQLLYEPFTIQCGHTYCYECLCNWFVPNKRKKTCPECRTIIKQMPAPSFMIKQMVEVFVNRAELMPADESVDQHASKRAEDIANVEKDRNAPEGLFKGLFPPGRQEPILDDADGVYRCPHCNSEYNGGPSCITCGAAVDGLDMFDFDGDDLDSEAFDDEMREELELEFADQQGGHNHNHLARMHHFAFGHFNHVHQAHHQARELSSSAISDSDEGEGEDIDDSQELSDSDDEEGSLRDFVAPDNSPDHHRRRREGAPRHYDNAHVEVAPHAAPSRRAPIEISDDDDEEEEDSDEGGPIVTRGRRARWSRQISTPPRVINLAEDESSASDTGDQESVADRLRYDGWSPLHEVEPDELDESHHQVRDSLDESDDDSDTETMRDDEGGSPRARIGRPDFILRAGRRQHGYEESDADDDGSEDGRSSVMDRDGDTEMSVSPDARAASRHHYDEYPESEASHADTEYDLEGAGELGNGHNIHAYDDDTSNNWSSDTPHHRRRRVQLHGQEQEEGYDRRISQMFAHHQDNMLREGSRRNPTGPGNNDFMIADLDDFEGLDFNHDHSVRQPARTPRARGPTGLHRVQNYRSQSARRRTQSPSATRIISSSYRPPRVTRPYIDRSNGTSEVRYY